MSIFNDSVPFAEATNISHFSVVGGWIPWSSGVKIGFSQIIL
jgi:hypothetical protein